MTYGYLVATFKYLLTRHKFIGPAGDSLPLRLILEGHSNKILPSPNYQGRRVAYAAGIIVQGKGESAHWFLKKVNAYCRIKV